MKKKLHLFFFFTLPFFLVISCAKYSKMLDIDLGNMGIDGDMNWGIPLINAGYEIEKILNQFGNMGFIDYDENGNYRFEYTVPKQEFLNVGDLNKVPYAEGTFDLDFSLSDKSLMNLVFEETFENNNIEIPEDEFKIHYAILKSGQIIFDFSHITVPSGINYEAHITSTNIRRPDRSNFEVTVPKNNSFKVSEDCNGLTILPDESQLKFEITIKLTVSSSIIPPSNLHFNPIISIKDGIAKEAKVELQKEHSYPVSVATEFSVFPKNLDLDVTIYGTKLMFDITNTFGFPLDMKINKAYLKGVGVPPSSILKYDDAEIHIDYPITEPVSISDYINPSLHITSAYDSLVFEFLPYIKKGEVITIYDNSAVATGVNFSMPFDIQIDKATFSDTLAFNLPGLSTLSILDVVTIRTGFESSIPSDFDVQILLYNSTKQMVIDSLLKDPVRIKGSYNPAGTSVPTTPQYIEITNDRISNLQDADKMILRLSLNTNGYHKSFNQSNSLRARIGARIKTSTEF